MAAHAAANQPLASPGERLWSKRYNGPGNGFDAASAVAVGPDGRTVFVTGVSDNAATTVAYIAATGARLWVSRYVAPGDQANPAAVRVRPDGGTVYVAGTRVGVASGSDYFTAAYDAATGAPRWLSIYNDQANGSDIAAAMGLSQNGTRVYMTGTGTGPSSNDYVTVSYNAVTGRRQWVARYDGRSKLSDAASSIAVGGRTVYVTGSSLTGDWTFEYNTVAYAASTGRRLWTAHYSRAGVAASLALGPGGDRVFLTGATAKAALTVAYQAGAGNQLWARRYAGPGVSGAVMSGVAVGRLGKVVFVAGTTEQIGPSRRQDYLTLAYAAAAGSGPGSTTARRAAPITPPPSRSDPVAMPWSSPGRARAAAPWPTTPRSPTTPSPAPSNGPGGTTARSAATTARPAWR